MEKTEYWTKGPEGGDVDWVMTSDISGVTWEAIFQQLGTLVDLSVYTDELSFIGSNDDRIMIVSGEDLSLRLGLGKEAGTIPRRIGVKRAFKKAVKAAQKAAEAAE